MLSKKTKKLLLQSGVALSITLSSFGLSSFQPVTAYAAVVDTAGGTLTVTAASLWAYSAPSWTAKSKTYSAGTILRVVEKHSVDGRFMYKLDNGLYISANTAYVSFAPSGAVTAPAPAPTPAPVPAPAPTVETRSTTVNLNMRSGAGTNFGILVTIPKGTALTIQSVSGTWAKVSYAGKTGYVSTAYLTQPTTTTPPVTTTPPPVTAPAPSGDTRTTTANLNMRSGAGTNFGILATVPKGTVLTIQSVSGTWAKVSYAGKTGYVSTAYLTQPATTTPPVTTTPPPVTSPAQDVRTTTVNLNMRSGAGTTYGILATIPKGTSLTVQSVTGTWAKVSYAGKTGYVSTTYLTAQAAPVEKPALPTMLTVDLAPVSTYNNTDISVSGWTLSDAGIKEVRILVDGVVVGTAARAGRPDVEALFTSYENRSSSGFSYTIPKNTVSIGAHVVTLLSVSNDGTTKEVRYNIDMVKEAPVVAITSHAPDSKVNLAKTTIEGYALNVDGVSSVEVYLNGTKIGNASYGTAKDGLEQYGTYLDYVNSGFSITFDTKTMNAGENTVKVVMRGRDGTDKSRSIRLYNHELYLFRDYATTLTHNAEKEFLRGTAVTSSAGAWVPASLDQIRFYMDSARFMNDPVYKYMFMKLNYIEVDTAVINQMLAGKGILDGMGETIKNVARLKNVNPLYVAAHTILETGNGTSVLARGVEVRELHATFGDIASEVTILDTPLTVYNMFGIGAWDSNPVLWGSEKAYKEGWVTPELAIAGGIAWIADGYINHTTFQQNTLYKMRYRLVDSGTIHQYATDIAWHYKQARILEREFAKISSLPRLEFEIPRFRAE